jgi:hypothetical protein
MALNVEQIDRLDRVSRPLLGYPHDLLAQARSDGGLAKASLVL